LLEFSLDFPRAYGALTAAGDFRQRPEDFKVDEELGYEPCGSGEHVYLQLCKRGENTAWVAEKIAELAQVSSSDIGFCGRKDRHAVTTQWFSVYLPKVSSAPDWAALNTDSVALLRVTRHSHKLRRGEHLRNHFVIRLRNIDATNRDELSEKIATVFAGGVPNYFGEQRFGRNANNLVEAQAILVEGRRYKDKQKRGLMLSAARSYLFNQVLAARVLQQNWLVSIAGEPLPVPTGPLWGRGRGLASDDLALLETEVLTQWLAWAEGLEHVGLNQERRPLMLMPENAAFEWQGQDL
jgi:tRNA pseudouridine13 synthase